VVRFYIVCGAHQCWFGCVLPMLSGFVGRGISEEEGGLSLVPSSTRVADCVRVSVDVV